MGSTATIYGVVALAIALVCLLAGFLWGRSNAKAQVERAVEQEHTALDAREFAMRQQVEDAIAEVGRLRPLADELGRVQERLRIEQAKYEQIKTEFSATLQGATARESAEQKSEVQSQPSSPHQESADEQIQKLLQSLEENFNEPEEHPLPIAEPQIAKPSIPPAVEKKPVVPPVVAKQPSPPPVASPKPAAPQLNEKKPPAPPPASPKPPAPPAANVKPATPKPATPQPVSPKSTAPKSSEVDEWQEFARSLASLTERKK
jgi:hypothetical protein